MKKYLFKMRWLLAGSVVVSIIESVVTAVMLLFPGWLVDGYKKGLPYMEKLFAGYTVTFVLYLLMAYLGNRCGDKRRLGFEKMLKKDFFDSVISRNFKSFHEYDISEYISMQANDIAEMTQNYMNPLYSIFNSTIMIVVFGISLIIFVNVYVTIFIIGFTVLTVFVPRITANELAKRNRAYLDGLGKYTKSIHTYFKSHVILDRDGQDTIKRRHNDDLNGVFLKYMNYRKLNSLAMVINGGSVDAVSLITFIAVAILLFHGKITLGMATIAFNYSTKFMEPMYELNTEIGTVLSVRDIQKKLLDIINGGSIDSANSEEIHEISTTELTKNYNDTKIHIEPLRMDYPGKYLVTGENGAGKSVLFRMLMHFEEPDTGKILYNNRDLPDGISESVCYLPQNPVIFDASLLDNVTIYGTYSADKLAEYETYFPDSIIKHVKESTDPENLSGGEKQVIALLRALCSAKPVILLDEPFSAMNQVTIDTFMSRMKDIKRLMVIIAHNLDNYEGLFDEKFVIKR
ncbi:MAG: ABC transporter ATP-binding protein [Catonella sp.]|nr:ABC transporter ATP-binding protein [Catonella sp.]MDY6356303.1 ABC transporter ATP-binding protein [Catonella sp.]